MFAEARKDHTSPEQNSSATIFLTLQTMKVGMEISEISEKWIFTLAAYMSISIGALGSGHCLVFLSFYLLILLVLWMEYLLSTF